MCFDYRIMNSEKGFFFIPGVDLGIVYSMFQTKLIQAKLPDVNMHRDVIVMNSRRWTAPELLDRGVLEAAVPGDDVLGQ